MQSKTPFQPIASFLPLLSAAEQKKLAEMTENENEKAQREFAPLIRERVVAYLRKGKGTVARNFRKNCEEYEGISPEKYLKKQSQPDTWGTDLELAAVREMLNCKVEVTLREGQPPVPLLSAYDDYEEVTDTLSTESEIPEENAGENGQSPNKEQSSYIFILRMVNLRNRHFELIDQEILGDNRCCYNSVAIGMGKSIIEYNKNLNAQAAVFVQGQQDDQAGSVKQLQLRPSVKQAKKVEEEVVKKEVTFAQPEELLEDPAPRKESRLEKNLEFLMSLSAWIFGQEETVEQQELLEKIPSERAQETNRPTPAPALRIKAPAPDLKPQMEEDFRLALKLQEEEDHRFALKLQEEEDHYFALQLQEEEYRLAASPQKQEAAKLTGTWCTIFAPKPSAVPRSGLDEAAIQQLVATPSAAPAA